MLRFSHFLIEATTMSSKAGTNDTERHIRQYLTPEIMQQHEYEVKKAYGDIQAGEKLKLTGTKVINGVVHGETVHGGVRKTIPIHRLLKPKVGRAGSDPEKAEKYHLDTLNKQIEEAKAKHGVGELVIHTEHGPIKVAGAAKAEKPKGMKGQPKADFVLHDKSGKPVRFMSHKDGTSPKDFQQLGGISGHMGHPAVKEFVDHLKQNHPTGVGGTGTVAFQLERENPEHHELIHKMTFGNDYGSKSFGINNVHSIDQGEYRLEPHPNGKKGHYVLRSHHSWQNGQIPQGQQFMIHAMPRSDRNDAGIPQTRITVAPSESRKVHKIVKPAKPHFTESTRRFFPEPLVEEKLRVGIKHAKDLSHGELGQLLNSKTLDGDVTEKSDGMAFAFGHDEHGFYTRTSHSEKMRQPEDYEAAARAKFGDGFDPTISQHFGRIHRALQSNTALLNHLSSKGKPTMVKGEVFYRPHGRPAEEHPNHVRFVGTAYDTRKMGNLGSFVVHSRLPENQEHDLEKLKSLGDHNFNIHDDKVPGGSNIKADVNDIKSEYDKIDVEKLTSRKAADKQAKEQEQQKLDAVRTKLDNRLRAHTHVLDNKWGNETEGHIFHPADSSLPRVKLISDTFKQNKQSFGFTKK